MKKALLLVVIISCISCGRDPIPKPKAFLRLDYLKPQYSKFEASLPFTFEKNNLATKISETEISEDKKTVGLQISYPSIKGTIFLTYYRINASNLQLFISDAKKSTQSHAGKAEAISKQPFVSSKHNVYGMFFEVDGNAASQAQFYVTDSLNHFLTGALYFYVKPNYDSILPAANYIKKDIQHIMETLRWDD